MKNIIILLLGVILTFYSVISECQSGAAPVQDEIQVLIDVSGSMKQNDPQNIRIEAVKLMINLLPANLKTAIWLFDENVQELTHVEAVDENWKKNALKLLPKIHSRGIYTDIEKATKTVLEHGFTGNGEKSLILLTDGFVDISKDIMVSADSRERLLSEWLPKLQQNKIKVLAIALSNQADSELMNKLAYATGGWSLTANKAEELQRSFMKMLLKAAPKDNVPLQGNHFDVDSSVKEFSVLVFKRSNSAESELFAPDQSKITKNSASKDVSWMETPAYELITVKNPAVGQWRLEADTDPDNQIMIVTDLKMIAAELPNYIAEKQAVDVKVSFTDKQQLITNDDFLRLLSITLTVDNQPSAPLKPTPGQPGFFGYTVKELPKGKHSLNIEADGKTFKRELLHEVQVNSEAIRVETLADPEKRAVSVNLIPDLTLLDEHSLELEASIVQDGEAARQQKISQHDGKWILNFDKVAAGSKIGVNFNALAKTLDGKPYPIEVKPVLISDELFEKTVAIAEKEQDSPEPAEAEEVQASPETSEQTETDWTLVGAIVVGINLFLLGGGFLIYSQLKKANAKKQQQILERLS